MGLYSPEKRTSEIPFTISFDNPYIDADKKLCNIKGFNNESFDDLFMKSIPPKNIYFKEVSCNLKNNSEIIASFHGYFINTNLLCKDEVTMEDAWKKENLYPALKYFFDSFIDEDGNVCYPINNIFFLDSIFVSPPYRKQGFAYYLAENLPDILTRYYGYTFEYIFVNLRKIITLKDQEIYKTEREIEKFILQSWKSVTNIFVSLGYQIFLEHPVNHFCCLSKEFPIDPTVYIR